MATPQIGTGGSMFIPYNFKPKTTPGTGVPGANNSLAGGVNAFMTQQAMLPFLQNLPGYANMVGQRSTNALSMLRGELPPDVQQQIVQGSAERGIAGGSPGSPNANAAYLRALGLTSLDMQNQGSQQLSQSIADTPVPELWNPMSLFVPQTLAADEARYAQQGIRAGAKAAAPAAEKKEYSLSYIDPNMGTERNIYRYYK